MFRILSLLALGLSFLSAGAGIAAAQPMPDLKGTWSGTSKTIVAGLASHHPTTTAAKQAGPNRLTEVKFTAKVDGQEGNRVWGTISSPSTTDQFIGVVLPDGKRIRLVLQRGGILDGMLVNPDTIELVYTEHSGGISVAATNTWTRQK